MEGVLQKIVMQIYPIQGICYQQYIHELYLHVMKLMVIFYTDLKESLDAEKSTTSHGPGRVSVLFDRKTVLRCTPKSCGQEREEFFFFFWHATRRDNVIGHMWTWASCFG